ncbi:MAG: hypothetical protein ACPGJS_07895, partial [Flammeovirgaceae bacterium]
LDSIDHIRTLISKYQEITPETDITSKLAEIHNFSELINFEIVLDDTKSYIEQIQSTLNRVEPAKG